MVGPCAHREDSGTPSSSLCPPPTTWVGSSSCLRGACWHGLSQLAWAVFHRLSQSQFILSLSSLGHMREPREDSNHKVTKPGSLCRAHGSLVCWGALHIGGLPLLWELGFLGWLWRFVSCLLAGGAQTRSGIPCLSPPWLPSAHSTPTFLGPIFSTSLPCSQPWSFQADGIISQACPGCSHPVPLAWGPCVHSFFFFFF